MIVSYRGHEIEVNREPSTSGDKLLFYSVFRESDQYECLSGYSYDASPVRKFVKHLKDRVDKELKKEDPWDEKADEEFENEY